MTDFSQLVSIFVVPNGIPLELLFIEREVVIRNRGSLEFSPAEQAADIVLVDVKCNAIQGTEYANLKTLPPYGYYGDVTLFGGATVRERISLRFVYQRVLDFESIYRRLRCYLTRIELQQDDVQEDNPNVFFDPLGNAVLSDQFEYRGLPYTKLKLNSERLAQHTVTIRHYTEDTGFACQAQSKPDDPTKGEDEYPTPLPIPPNGQFPPELPSPDLPYPDANPDDFPEGTPSGNYPRPVYFGIRIDASSGNGAPNCTMDNSFPRNFLWENAGPPPYTIEYGYDPGPCSNAKHGLRVVSGDGTKSPEQAPFTVFGGEIIVFSFNPIGGEQ